MSAAAYALHHLIARLRDDDCTLLAFDVEDPAKVLVEGTDE
jgi:hypothetical protein